MNIPGSMGELFWVGRGKMLSNNHNMLTLMKTILTLTRFYLKFKFMLLPSTIKNLFKKI